MAKCMSELTAQEAYTKYAQTEKQPQTFVEWLKAGEVILSDVEPDKQTVLMKTKR